MNLFSGLFKTFAPTNKKETLTLTEPTGWKKLFGQTEFTGKRVSEQAFLELTTVWSCIRLISESISILPLVLYQRTENGREKAKKHPYYDLFKQKPNHYMTTVEFLEQLVVSLCVWGQAYIYVSKFNGKIWEMYPLPRNFVQPELVNGEPIYHVYQNGKYQQKGIDEIIPIKGFGGDGLEGYAPYKYAENAASVALAAEEYGGRYFGNGARPGGFIIFDGNLTKKQRQDFMETYNKTHQGVNKSNKIGVLWNGAKFQPVFSPNNESQFIELRKFQIAEIARVFRVPLSMLYEMDKATYNNTEQSNKHFIDFTLSAYLKRIEQALNCFLLNDKERKEYYFEFNLNGLLRGDSKARAEYYLKMRQMAAIKVNEIRESENLPLAEGGDDIRLPLNTNPLPNTNEDSQTDDDEKEAA